VSGRLDLALEWDIATKVGGTACMHAHGVKRGRSFVC